MVNSSVVVDTSLAVKWVLIETDSSDARRLRERWRRDGVQPIVPSWFACEVANVLYQRLRAGRYTLPEIRRSLGEVLTFVAVRDFEAVVADRGLEIAALLGQKASYDAHYVALAERAGCDLWTADERFWNAAKGAFPRVRWLHE